jgi:cytochrome c-type biogenesis protein CcmH/NrfG
MQWVPSVDLKKTEALAALSREAVARAPNVVANWLSLGRVLITLGEFGEASRSLGKAVAATPSSPELHLLLA